MARAASDRCLLWAAWVLLCAGCGTYSSNMRQQQPFFQSSGPSSIALLQVQLDPELQPVAPEAYADVPATLAVALAQAFAGSAFTIVDRQELPLPLRFSPKVSASSPTSAAKEPGDCQTQLETYQAQLSGPIPPEVSEPLFLGAHVLRWTLTSSRGPSKGERAAASAQAASEGNPVGVGLAALAGGKDYRVIVDVVFSLWTRQGRQIETRRVRAEFFHQCPLPNCTRFAPEHRCVSGWLKARDEGLDRRSPKKAQSAFRLAVETATRGFAWLYRQDTVEDFITWDTSDPRVEPGVELARQDRLAEALRSLEAVLEKTPSLASALYDSAAILELQGKDEAALQRYERALAQGSSLAAERAKAVRQRIAWRRSLPPLVGAEKTPAAAAPDQDR